MNLTRRRLIAGIAASGVATRLWATTETTIGAGRLMTLSDGHLVLPESMAYSELPDDLAAELMARYGVDPAGTTDRPCNLTLWQNGEDTVLFDAGSGPGFMPTAGRILDALDAAGIAPDDITHVVMTHGHPDHLWGVLDDFDDLLFPDARHFMGAVETDYWRDPDTATSIGEARAIFVAGAMRRLDALDGILETFEDGAEISAGVTARASFGHTPGHMSFRLSDGDAQAMVIGDAIPNETIAFDMPDLPLGTDQDTETAAATRVALLDELATDGIPVVGFHLPGDGLGRVAREGDAYRFDPL